MNDDTVNPDDTVNDTVNYDLNRENLIQKIRDNGSAWLLAQIRSVVEAEMKPSNIRTSEEGWEQINEYVAAQTKAQTRTDAERKEANRKFCEEHLDYFKKLADERRNEYKG